MASDICKGQTNSDRGNLCHDYMGYSFHSSARDLLHAPPYRQDSTYHIICYTNREALAGMKNRNQKSKYLYNIKKKLSPTCLFL